MLGLRRTTVPRGTALQTGEQIIIQLADVQISRHLPGSNAIIEDNDLIIARSVAGQGAKLDRHAGKRLVGDRFTRLTATPQFCILPCCGF